MPSWFCCFHCSVDQVESGRETGRSVLEKGGYAQLARPTLDHKSDILLTGGRLKSFSRESALEAHPSAWTLGC